MEKTVRFPQKLRYFDNKGMLLVEVLLAVTIVSVALLAIGGLVVSSTKSLTTNDINSIAYKTAQQRIEALKSVSTQDWKDIGFTNSYQNVATAIASVANETTRAALTTSIITKTTPTIDSRCTVTTEGRTENNANNSLLTGTGSRLVKVRVIASCILAAQTSQVELVSLFGKEP